MTDTATIEAAEGAVLELMTPDGMHDPYPILHRLRQLDPFHKSAMGFRLLTRLDDVTAVLHDPRFGHQFEKELVKKGYPDWREHPGMLHFYSNMLVMDPPDHTRLRKLVNRAFTPRVVEQNRPRIQARVRELLDALGDGEGDFIQAVAYALPVSVIGDLIGVPREEQAPFGKWVEDWSNQLELVITEEGLALADTAAQEMFEYFHSLIGRRRSEAELGDDLLGRLMGVEVDGETLSDDEIVHMLMLVFSAGFDTTTHLIGNGLLALLEFPDQLDLLRREPERTEDAVEEMLRFDTSIQMTNRHATEDLDLDGHHIEAGEMVLLSIGGANRDPAHFPEPDRFDITRDDKGHVSFGHGVHYCLGAALARLETYELFRELLVRYSDIELTGEPERRLRVNFRALNSLPLRLKAA